MIPRTASTQTIEMVATGQISRFQLLKLIFRDFDLLQVVATATHQVWGAKDESVLVTNVEAFLNNMAGPIALLKAIEDQLMDEGRYTAEKAEKRILKLIRRYIDVEFPSETVLRSNPNALEQFLRVHKFVRKAMHFANTTWFMRAVTRIDSGKPRLARFNNVNLFPELVSSDWTEEEMSVADEVTRNKMRFDRHMTAVKDFDQIREVSKWLMAIFTNPQSLVPELQRLHDLAEQVKANVPA